MIRVCVSHTKNKSLKNKEVLISYYLITHFYLQHSKNHFSKLLNLKLD